jgi:hypothetical protein
LGEREMSVNVNKINGKVTSVHLYDTELSELINIIDQLWCDFAHRETKEGYATNWPRGYAAIKELLKEVY